MNKKYNSTLLNTVVSGPGMKYPRKPSVILGEVGEFAQGDLMDANAVQGAIDDAISGEGGITERLNEEVTARAAADDALQSEIDQMGDVIAAINQFDYTPADELPTASSDTMYKIYLVPSEDPQQQNIKDEFITVESNGTYSWEQIGSTAIDLSGYYTSAQVDTALSTKASSADLATVATSGSYNDLTNKPTIPAAQVQADWSQTNTSEKDYIKNKPTNISTFTNDAGYLTQHQDISGKQNTLVSGETIKTINGQNVLGSGNITVSASGTISDKELIFDISDYNAINNVPATYQSLSSALAAVPSTKQVGGITVKFIHFTPATYNVVKTEGLEEQPTGTALASASSVTDGIYTASDLSDFATLPDVVGNTITYYIAVTETVDEIEVTTYTTWVVTKLTSDIETYVQYRLTNPSWSTNVKDWQGVDDVPTANSNNLVKSSGLYDEVIKYEGGTYSILESLRVSQTGKVYNRYGNIANGPGQIYEPVHLDKGDIITFEIPVDGSTYGVSLLLLDNGDGTVKPLFVADYRANKTATFQYTAVADCNVILSCRGALLRCTITKRGKNEEYAKLVEKEYYSLDLIWYVSLPSHGDTLSWSSITGGGQDSDAGRVLVPCKEGDVFVFNCVSSAIKDDWCVIDENNVVILNYQSLLLEEHVPDFEITIPKGGKYLLVQNKKSRLANPYVYKKVKEGEGNEGKIIEYEDLSKLHSITNGSADFSNLEVGAHFSYTRLQWSSLWHVVNVEPGEIYTLSNACTFGGNNGSCIICDKDWIVIKIIPLYLGVWQYATEIEIPDGGCHMMYNSFTKSDAQGRTCVLKRYKRGSITIYDYNNHKLPALLGMCGRVISTGESGGTNYYKKRLVLSWASDSHFDMNLYQRWVEYTEKFSVIDAALHTGDFNRMSDDDEGFVNTAQKYPFTIPFLPVLGNHDAFGQSRQGDFVSSGSRIWNGEKYILPFMDDSCVSGENYCYYYRDFTDKKIRIIVLNDYDMPRYVDGTYWVTTTDETEIASATDWIAGTSYAVGSIVLYKGLYLKCVTASYIPSDASSWPNDNAPVSKFSIGARYFTQEQIDFIINAMNVSAGWGIIFATHMPFETMPSSANIVDKWTVYNWNTLGNIDVRFGQNGYILQDIITAYLNRTTLSKTYSAISPTSNPTGTVTLINQPDYLPDVTINADFTSAVGDVICLLNGHQHSDSCYYSEKCGNNKVLCIGNTCNCHIPTKEYTRWFSGDLVREYPVKDCFNIISIDTDEKCVYLLRIGADTNDRLEKRDYIRLSYAHT